MGEVVPINRRVASALQIREAEIQQRVNEIGTLIAQLSCEMPDWAYRMGTIMRAIAEARAATEARP
jgi:hypothetical protein